MKTSIKNLVYFLVLFLLSLVLFSCYNPVYPPLGKKMSKELTASYNSIADELGIPNLPQGTKWLLDAETKPYDKKSLWDIQVCCVRKDNIFCHLNLKKEGNSYKIVKGTYYVYKYNYGSIFKPHLCFYFDMRDDEFLKKYKYQRLKITYEKYEYDTGKAEICREITRKEAYKYLRDWHPNGDFYENLIK